MWEKDKQLIHQYRECIANFMQEVRSGEEVDWEAACVVEGAKLQSYTFDMVDVYRMKHPQALSEKRQLMFTPRMPYFQNL